MDPHDTDVADSVAVLRSLKLSDGRRMSVRIWPGTGDETIVFLHGLFDSSEGWAATCERRDGSDGRPTLTRIAFDLPGFGDSDAPIIGSLDGYAQDVADALTQLDVERFILVGHSLGGGIATRLAELVSDRIDALVLLAPVGFGHIRLAELGALPLIREGVGIGMPLALSNRRAIDLCFRWIVANGHSPEPDVLERLLRRPPQMVAGAIAAIAAIAKSARGKDGFMRRRIAFDGPVVAIWGARARLVSPGHRQALRRALPQSRVELWTGMGHHPQRERLEDLLMLIRRISAPDQRIALPAV